MSWKVHNNYTSSNDLIITQSLTVSTGDLITAAHPDPEPNDQGVVANPESSTAVQPQDSIGKSLILFTDRQEKITIIMLL